MSLKYAYCRISTTDQNIDRQIIAVKQFAPDISDNNIFVDKKTGKDFEREQYQEMKTILDKGIMPSEKVLDFPVDCNTLTGSVNL